MTLTIDLLLLIIAAACFAIGAWGWAPRANWNWACAGLFFWVCTNFVG